MKKIALFLLAVIVLSTSTYASGKKRKPVRGRGKSQSSMGYYSFSVGPSLALGDYAAKAPNEQFGNAKTFLHLDIANMGFNLSENFGISALVTLGANKFNAKEVTGFQDNNSYWIYSGIMVGPFVTFPAGDLVSIDFRPVAGFTYDFSPEANSAGSGWIIKSANTTSFGFDIGASMRYHMTDHLDLALNLDYFSTKPDFKVKMDLMNNLVITEVSVKQQITVLGIGAGLAFRF
ncbi:MAG: hypothetical protein NTU44_04360 [Bacteroidetes bacterium]|nr:hypothetical protein [Bacteroidota bacterium]